MAIIAAYAHIGAGRERSPDETKRARVLALWRRAGPTRGTPAERYFRRRGLPWLVECEWIRFCADCSHPGGVRAPALVAMLLDAAGNVAGAQRIYITGDGNKSDLEPRRAGLGHVAGHAIHVHPPAAEMVVAEGLETAASAAVLLERPAWAACGAGNLGWSMRLPPLPLARDVLIACDRDPPGMRAAEAAAKRWRAEGRVVAIASPDRLGRDFNDILVGRHYER